MGLFRSSEDKAKEMAEIIERVENSECAAVFSRAICATFSEGGEYYQWLLANSKERHIKMDVYKDGVGFELIEVNHRRYKETGTYTVNTEGIGFGPSGYADLPNSKYKDVFERFLRDAIKENCPNVEFIDYCRIKLKECAKKGW